MNCCGSWLFFLITPLASSIDYLILTSHLTFSVKVFVFFGKPTYFPLPLYPHSRATFHIFQHTSQITQSASTLSTADPLLLHSLLSLPTFALPFSLSLIIPNTLFSTTSTPSQVKMEPNQVRTCSVCLEEVWQGSETRCGHVFHTTCLFPWLHAHPSHPTCPVCRNLCWPNAVDTNYFFIAFLGVLQGNQNSPENIAPQVQNDTNDSNEEDEVEWVMDIEYPLENTANSDVEVV